MSKYRIHIDKPLPDKKQIQGHKDFTHLYGRYETAVRFSFWRKLRTQPRYFATVVMIAAIAWLVYDTAYQERQDARSFVSAPFEVDIAYQQQPLHADQAIDFGEEQTRVRFWIKEGLSYPNGPTHLAYRELKDPADLFIAGVPMHIRGEGAEDLLASAAMLEVIALRDQKPVAVEGPLDIQVVYLSASSSRDYGIYYLDTIQQSWIYMGKDSVVPILTEADILAQLPPRPRLQRITQAGADKMKPKAIAPRPKPGRVADLKAWQARYKQVHDSLSLRVAAKRHFRIHRLGYYCLGRVLPQPDRGHAFRLTGPSGKKNLSRKLGKKEQTLWLVQPGYNTLRPCSYDGEGHHQAMHYADTSFVLWTRDPPRPSRHGVSPRIRSLSRSRF